MAETKYLPIPKDRALLLEDPSDPPGGTGRVVRDVKKMVSMNRL
jgi:hypothetical protein